MLYLLPVRYSCGNNAKHVLAFDSDSFNVNHKHRPTFGFTRDVKAILAGTPVQRIELNKSVIVKKHPRRSVETDAMLPKIYLRFLVIPCKLMYYIMIEGLAALGRVEPCGTVASVPAVTSRILGFALPPLRYSFKAAVSLTELLPLDFVMKSQPNPAAFYRRRSEPEPRHERGGQL